MALKNPRICQMQGCEKTEVAIGMCGTHYERHRKYGDASIVGTTLKDISGQKFNLLTAKSYRIVVDDKGNRKTLWLCECECGNTVETIGAKLKSGHTKSCGCIQKKKSALNLMMYTYTRNAEQKGFAMDLSEEQFLEIIRSDCFYCGIAPSEGYYTNRGREEGFLYNGIDRINNGKGYFWDNCVPCCGQCNRMKGSFSQKDFLIKVLEISRHLKKGERFDQIVQNMAKCLRCGEIVVSEFRHDFVTCSCGSLSVDGGNAYLRRVGEREDWEEMSVGF